MNQNKDPDGFAQKDPLDRLHVPGVDETMAAFSKGEPHPVTDDLDDAAQAELDEQAQDPKGFFFSQTSDGGLIPAWHATWRYQMGDGIADNAVIGLHWIMRALWFTWVWIKAGARNVPIDPHEAFFQGQQLGYKEAIETLPADIQLKAHTADGRMAQAQEFMRHFGVWQAIEMQYRGVEEAYNAKDLPALKLAIEGLIAVHTEAKARQPLAPILPVTENGPY